MARDFNKVLLIGRLAADPELRTTASGQTVANLRVATSRQWTDGQGQTQSQTEFTTVVAWARLADLVHQYLRKGRQVFVEGRLQTRSFVDKANQKQWRTEVVAENVIFLGAPSAPEAERMAGRSAPGAKVPRAPSDTAKPPAAPTVTAAAPAGRAEEPLEEIRIEDIPF